MKSLLFYCFLAGMFMSMNANATVISSSNGCSSDPAVSSDAGCDPTVIGNYGFDISIESTDNLTWAFTLDNTSLDVAPLIDMFAINVGATLGTDFTVANFNPATWTFSEPGGGGIQFDYIGERGVPGSRLGSGEFLTFDFLFAVEHDYTVFTDVFADVGTGIGGGSTDLGQFLVSFQALGVDGEGSDLIGDSWQSIIGGGGGDDEPPPPTVAEPGILALMGLGLVGLGIAGSKREERKMKKYRK